MIRVATACPGNRLIDLLDDLLPPDELRTVSSHLEQCETCRHRLEQLAAAPEIWEETVSVLSDASLRGDASATSHVGPLIRSAGHTTGDQVENPRGDGPVERDHLRSLLPFLQPCEDDRYLGRLDAYGIESVVGWGGMGVVLRGHDESLGRPVAIKVLHPHLAAHGAARRRFGREARAAAAINHPSVVPIHSVNAEAHPPYLVMAYIPGGSLQDRIDREGPLETSEVLRIAYQIADALSAAHAQGLVHRDVKPANILLDHGQNRVMLSDFGLAQALDDATLTASGQISGTPQYMSPEQARGDTVDARSDLYSLGGVMYAMATGRPPFRGHSTLAVLRKIGNETPRPVDEINPDVPHWLAHLIASLQATRVEDRPSSASEAAQLVRECLVHVRHPTANPLPRTLPVKKPPVPATHRSDRSRWFIAAAALGLLALLGPLGAVVLWFASAASGRPETRPEVLQRPSATAPVSEGALMPLRVTPSVGNALPSPIMESPPDITRWDDGMDQPLAEVEWLLDAAARPEFPN